MKENTVWWGRGWCISPSWLKTVCVYGQDQAFHLGFVTFWRWLRCLILSLCAFWLCISSYIFICSLVTGWEGMMICVVQILEFGGEKCNKRQLFILFHSSKGYRSVSQIPIESLAEDGDWEERWVCFFCSVLNQEISSYTDFPFLLSKENAE